MLKDANAMKSNYDIPQLPPKKRVWETMSDLKAQTGLNQTQLGELFGVNQSTIARWFDEQTDLSYEQVRSIVSVLVGICTGVSPTKTLEDICTRNPTTTEISGTVRNAVKKMQDGEFSQLPIVDENEKYIGMLTDHSIVRYLVSPKPRNRTSEPSVRDLKRFYETPSPTTLDTLVVTVAHLLEQNYALAVKNTLNDKEVVAIVTRADMLKLVE